jgi:predicted GNAT family N-acyltransferase
VSAGDFTLRLTDWQRDEPALRCVRRAVFIDEQRIAENLEWDEVDAACVHALAEEGAAVPIGCGRLLPDGHIGRMAVLASWRGRGVGDALLRALIEAARARGHARAILNAQVQAIPFYARHGFAPQGPAFDEAGIPHQVMTRSLV